MNFPIYIEFKDLLNDKITELLNLLDINNSFESNMLTKKYQDNNLFNWIEDNIIKNISNNGINYHLLNLETIKYKPGDNFEKHQDCTDFNSNEFINYTFLLNLISCEEGGEIILHFDDNKYIFESNNLGSLLLFKRNIIYEDLDVIKGEKYILKGYLLGFNDNNNNQDVVIVTLKKSPNLQYILPAYKINNTMYGAFYNFSKQQNPNQHVFYFNDEEISKDSFEYYYNMYIKEYTIEEIFNRNKELDYIGIQNNDVLSKINDFINDANEDIMLLSYDNYYKLVNVNFGENIIPFNMVTFSVGIHEIIIWCGIYNNLFITCDPNMPGLTDQHIYNMDKKTDITFDNGSNDEFYYYSDDSDNKNDSNNDFDIIFRNHSNDSDSDSEYYSDSDYYSDFDSDYYANETADEYGNSVKKLLDKLKINGPSFFIPSKEWSRYIEHFDVKMTLFIRKYLWEQYGLRPINEMTMINNNCNDSLRKYVNKIINGLSKRNDDAYNTVLRGYNETIEIDHHYQSHLKKKYKLIDNMKQLTETFKKSSIIINPNIRNINVNNFVDAILKTNHISELDKIGVFDYINRKNIHISWNIVYKMGFIKIDKFLENKSNK